MTEEDQNEVVAKKEDLTKPKELSKVTEEEPKTNKKLIMARGRGRGRGKGRGRGQKRGKPAEIEVNLDNEEAGQDQKNGESEASKRSSKVT